MVDTYKTPWTDKTLARKAVQFEYKIEFGMEGQHFFDLVRWGIAKDALTAYLAYEGKLPVAALGGASVEDARYNILDFEYVYNGGGVVVGDFNNDELQDLYVLKDPKWFPLLQTPPFPEYTSGHSVVSSASAVVLTHLYRDSFAYVDSVEVNYGLPPRSFPSFSAAAAEASRSRLYGGIHFLPAIENGVKQGQAIGNYLIQKLNLKR